MTKQPEINKKLLSFGDHPFCAEANWLRFSKTIYEYRETGQLTKAEFDCYQFLFYKANPADAKFITNFHEIQKWLGGSRNRASDVMKSLREKQCIYFESFQGIPKFPVYINYYPLMKVHDKQIQKFSYFYRSNITFSDLDSQKCDVGEETAKNPFSELRREFTDFQNASAKSIDIDQT